MVFQTGRNILVGYKAETTFGTLAGASAGKIFRPNTGSTALTKESINSNENRRDGQRTRGRHGSRAVAGQYDADLSLGSYDDFIEAVFRGTFAALLTVTQAAMSAATLSTTTSTIVASAGSWITAGLRVGDVIKFTTGLTGLAVNRNLRITALTATVITVAETINVIAGPVSTWSLTRPKKLLMGTTPRSFTIEEAELDIDASQVFTGCRLSSMNLQLQPNSMGTMSFNVVGQDMQVMSGASSPYYTSPTVTTSIGMTAVEAVIRLGTTDVVDLSALNLSINLNAAGFPVVGSVLTPDVFTNLATVEGSITALRQDLARVTSFLNEDQLSLHILFTENEADPKDFCSFFVGNLSLSGATPSNLGADGPRTQEIPLMIGIDERGGAYDNSTVVFSTSAA